MLYILTENGKQQAKLLFQTARKLEVPCLLLDLLDEELTVQITGEELYLNGCQISAKDRFYSCISPEFPFIPAAENGENRRYFSDSYAALQQRKSQAFSILSLLSRKNLLLNNFDRLNTLYSQIDILFKLERTGLTVVDYCITDTLDSLAQSRLGQLPEIFWSSIEQQSPLKLIRRADLGELLPPDNRQPYIFYRIVPGTPVRIWLLKGEPVLAALVTPPDCRENNLSLEKYDYIQDLDFFRAEATAIYQEFRLDFLEVHGIVSEPERQLIIYGLDPQPLFGELDPAGREWLAAKIIAYITGITAPQQQISGGRRSTVYLKKMLEPLISRKG